MTSYEFVTLTTSVCSCVHDCDWYFLREYCRATSEIGDAAVDVRLSCSCAQHSTVTHSLHFTWSDRSLCFLRVCDQSTGVLSPRSLQVGLTKNEMCFRTIEHLLNYRNVQPWTSWLERLLEHGSQFLSSAEESTYALELMPDRE